MKELVQKSGILYEGQKVYLGIDVHARNYQVSALINGDLLQRSVRLPAAGETLVKWAERQYVGGTLIFGYEAGFCGLSLSRYIKGCGYECRVLNPADIPTSDKERVHKNDVRDSAKIALALASPGVNYNYQIEPGAELLRQNVRAVWRYNVEVRRIQHKIVHSLYYLGLPIPCTPRGKKSWSKQNRQHIRRLAQQAGYLGIVLYVDQLEAALGYKKAQWNAIDQMLKASHLKEVYGLLQTMRGVGPMLSAIISTEIVDIHRFTSTDHLRSYAGLIPSEYSSGDKQRTGRMSRRANNTLRWALVQAAWRMIDYDPEIALRFQQWKKQCGQANKAIIKVACLILGRMAAMWRSGQPYQRPHLDEQLRRGLRGEAATVHPDA